MSEAPLVPDVAGADLDVVPRAVDVVTDDEGRNQEGRTRGQSDGADHDADVGGGLERPPLVRVLLKARRAVAARALLLEVREDRLVRDAEPGEEAHSDDADTRED